MGMFKRALACVIVLLALCEGKVSSKPYGGSAAIYNNPLVIAQMEHAWEADQNGTLRDGTWEYGFRIDYVGGKIEVGELVMGDDVRHVTIMTYPQTIAIAHVHPNAGVSTPSQLDMDGVYPDYVISKEGLYVTNPKTHTYQFLKKFDDQFKLPAPPRKQKA
jgi:hypothetical protein